MEMVGKVKKTKEFIRAVDDGGDETADHEITLLVGLSRREYLELVRATLRGDDVRITIIPAQMALPLDGEDWKLPG